MTTSPPAWVPDARQAVAPNHHGRHQAGPVPVPQLRLRHPRVRLPGPWPPLARHPLATPRREEAPMNPTAMTKACLAAATALQQLAAALEAEAAPCSDVLPPPGGGYVCARCGEEWQHHARRVVIPDPPASVAEPECGCSRYTRCDMHEAQRSKVCTCNGPYASSSCRIATHHEDAMRAPHRDPALVD